ncbi:unnamed protein product [Paramecium octaurelia]|uniref:Phosphofructokinase domain-containing protein n=1 Tax=Paramecium octaurelia TaxID=43137 RepID=A0A8S1TMT9_PAROT|nr:unnamed protein product [Paramecium octaurelia]
MESKNLTQTINPLYLLASLALGTIGAAAFNALRKGSSETAQHVFEESMSANASAPSSPKKPIKKHAINKLMAKNANENELVKELKNLEEITCEIERVSNLAYDLKLQVLPLNVNPMLGNSNYRSVFGGEGFLPETAFVNHDCYILQHPNFGPNDLLSRTKRWLRSGPRKHLLFSPDEVKAGIVVVGGLLPGLNVIIRELTMCLFYNYKVQNIFGAKNGYNGIYNNDWIKLDPKIVKTIHHQGGCFLGTARSKFDGEMIVDELAKNGINQVYLIGGLGCMKSAEQLHEIIKSRNLKISIVVIPKSIENEIPIIDKSFGFETAIEEAQNPLKAAYQETHSKKYSVGIVRLWGSHTGFLALNASLAFRSVNICLVPEFEFDVYGEKGLLEYVYQRLQHKGTCVIVVAEGSAASLRDCKINDKGRDASGNVKQGDIGLFLKNAILEFTREKGLNAEVKYIDPQYMVRAGKANSLDSKLCSQLAQNAIHASMAGFTGFAVGHVSNKTCMIPLNEMNSGNYANRITPSNISWQRLLAGTGQPSFLNNEQDI